jgi:hypothetical protein
MTSNISAPAARLVQVEHKPSGLWSSVTFEAWVGDRWIGWVHDEKDRTAGGRWTARRWTACHREAGDQHARWRGDMISTTRKGALEVLVAQITEDA